MAMAFAAGEVAVFVETNLGTRIAMSVSLDITSARFKSILDSFLIIITAQVFSFDLKTSSFSVLPITSAFSNFILSF